MNKQQIAHELEKEISLINIDLKSLHRIYVQTIDSQHARDINDLIHNLVRHKRCLEKVVEHIEEDSRNYSSSIKYDSIEK